MRRERAERVIAQCRELAACTDVEGETTRLFLSPATKGAHGLLAGWMRAAGMEVWTDAAGNLRGLLGDGDAPRLLLGSHIDTIANAGAYDGVLGVVLGIALAEELVAEKVTIPFAVEVIAFSEEEGVRFAKPFIGSLALVGELDAATLERRDRDGVSVAEAIGGFGLDVEELPAAVAGAGAFGYVEFHIEQGPVLENEGRSLGVVDAIAGQTRMQLTFTGQANHAGTTPMGHLRRDALAAAAQWIVEVERYANECAGLVATVGKVEVRAGAGNVIAGECVATLDVRHAEDPIRKLAVAHSLEYAEIAGAARGVSVAAATQLEQAAVPMAGSLTDLLAEAVAKTTGAPVRRMTSGAGHDAMIVARRMPAAMLFLRSPGGLSHHPEESVMVEDVEAALAAGLEFLRGLRDDSATLARLCAGVQARKEANA